MATVLVAPIISEKATHIAEKQNQVFFKVLRNATKPEIKAAVEVLFKVEVESAQTASRGAKAQRFGRRRVLKPALAPRRLASDDLDAAIQSVAG